MTTLDSGSGSSLPPRSGSTTQRVARRLSTETKAAPKTTEFIAYVVAVLGVLIASAVVGTGDSGTEDRDLFAADKAWLYITILTVGYLLSRGLAKSGSRDFYDDDNR